MAFDGITISALVSELREKLTGGRIYKIAQPEKDELLLTIKNQANQYRLIISSDASLPLLYLINENKKSPMTAPNFCMLLRKHIQNGRILSINQPGLERVVDIRIEHLNEMGDLCQKILTVELMGKYSNIIFRDDEKIIDSMKHVSQAVSSVREVLPGRSYFIPGSDKADLLQFDKTEEQDVFLATMAKRSEPVIKMIYQYFTGVAPVVASDICFRAGVDQDKPASSLELHERQSIQEELLKLSNHINKKDFFPNVVYENDTPVEYGVFPFSCYPGFFVKEYSSVSDLLFSFYQEKSTVTRIRQKSVDLRRIIQTAIERNSKKLDLQLSQLKDTEKRDKYRIYGELLHTYGYEAKDGEKSITVVNYYDNKELTIPLNPELSVMENAKKYFDRYGKLKRTFEALSKLSQETKAELDYLESVMVALKLAKTEDDLNQIREELSESGYIRKKSSGKKVRLTSKPLHYISSDGYHMYVGKNNFQNDELTFQMAEGGDWWFHAKGMPGSHVIVKCKGAELPDRTFEEAARLAAFYSKGSEQNKVEIDYIQKKHVKKPNGAKPGFVVYYTNYSMAIAPDISGIIEVTEK
ncbi:MAG: NFACT family protein [Lachnospiraceae bacterium]|nr:NFACT family protein [Lachnospiraceae bacterium]